MFMVPPSRLFFWSCYAGDCLIVVLLQRYKSSEAARFYALNPVSILVTAGHGQFDGLVFGLVALAWVGFQAEGRAWLLGGADVGRGYRAQGLSRLVSAALLIHLSSNKQR